MKIWWCNQSKGWKNEKAAGVVCSSGKATILKYREMVNECVTGDLIVHYCSSHVKAISQATSNGQAFTKETLPDPRLNMFEHGWYFKTNYFELEKPLHRSDFVELLTNHRNEIERPGYPMGPKGKVLQLYFMPFDIEGYKIIIDQIENLPPHLRLI